MLKILVLSEGDLHKEKKDTLLRDISYGDFDIDHRAILIADVVVFEKYSMAKILKNRYGKDDITFPTTEFHLLIDLYIK